MSPAEMINEFFRQLPARGYAGSIVSIQRLRELEDEIRGHYKQGLFDDGFYQERLEPFDFSLPNNLPEAKSLILIAVPSPQASVVFRYNGEMRTLMIPPTYVGYDRLYTEVENWLNVLLAPAGYHVAQAQWIPLKLLAVRSGLAEYGKNNISYVSGMGSFHQLVAVYSDLPCPQDNWREERMMERCQNCQACIRKCPTDAIPADRFLLHAERCITFHNEKPGDVLFPGWLDPAWHTCLIGCMHCQKICPENRNFLGWVEAQVEFSDEETQMLLDGVPARELPAETQKKLAQLDLAESLDILPRNLRGALRTTEVMEH